MAQGFLGIIEYFGWKKVSIITQDDFFETVRKGCLVLICISLSCMHYRIKEIFKVCIRLCKQACFPMRLCIPIPFMTPACIHSH